MNCVGLILNRGLLLTITISPRTGVVGLLYLPGVRWHVIRVLNPRSTSGSCWVTVGVAFLRATAECFVRLCHDFGDRPSVCPSVTPLSPIKTAQARITYCGLPQAL